MITTSKYLLLTLSALSLCVTAAPVEQQYFSLVRRTISCPGDQWMDLTLGPKKVKVCKEPFKKGAQGSIHLAKLDGVDVIAKRFFSQSDVGEPEKSWVLECKVLTKLGINHAEGKLTQSGGEIDRWVVMPKHDALQIMDTQSFKNAAAADRAASKTSGNKITTHCDQLADETLAKLKKAVDDLYKKTGYIHSDAHMGNVLWPEHGNTFGEPILIDFGLETPLWIEKEAAKDAEGTISFLVTSKFGVRDACDELAKESSAQLAQSPGKAATKH